ncbi:MAG: hypothetical protein A3G28_05765 [Betaproteobacteria bacterium RIFCSPLOWO2_12_FULL_68_19]|nr:hypothetical protein [Betaproteobacteria bacterium]OGA38815.1 MAG: hypothetical protein A3G28_05765 [Betaproteobacteria bacterium RIFCSPLOWO2_12_FULL_68_19]
MKLERYLNATPRQIERRWRQVDLAWHFERAMRANALPLAVAGALLSLLDRRFLAVPALIGGWLLLRRLRPAWTLAEEREALRLLRASRAASF